MSIEKTKVDGLCPHIMGADRIYLYESRDCEEM